MRTNPAVAKKLFSVGGSETILPTKSRVRATAAATIEPMGARDGATSRREHLIKILIELNQSDAKHADKAQVTATTRRALAAYAPKAGDVDRREVREVSTTQGKPGVSTSVVVAVEGTVVWPGRPTVASIEALSATLLEEGYRIVVRERRECIQSKCTTEALLAWNQLEEIPMGWCSNVVCGRHSYKSCTNCKSVYLCTSMNAAGQAPSVHCQVCGAVLMEWGSSKIWEAELVTRGEGAVAARSRERKRGG